MCFLKLTTVFLITSVLLVIKTVPRCVAIVQPWLVKPSGEENSTYPWVYTTNPCSTNDSSLYNPCSTARKNCNSTVCCLGMVDGTDNTERCIDGRNCTYLVQYEYEGPYNLTYPGSNWTIMNYTSPLRIRVRMTSVRRSPHYFAYGLSYNTKMGNDLVFVCELKSNRSVHFYTRWNHQHMNVMANTKWNTHITTDVRTEYDTNKSMATCEFYVPINLIYVHFSPTWNFSLVKGDSKYDKYYNLLAVGTVQPSGQLNYHFHMYTTGHVNNRWSYTNQCVSTAGYPTYIDEKIHASYMIGIWIILLPLNTAMARFYKLCSSTPFPVFGPVWLFIHVLISFLAWIMTFASYATVSGERNFQVSAFYPATIHSAMGFLSMALLTLEMAIGLLRTCDFHPLPIKWLKGPHALLHIPVLLLGYATIASTPLTTYNIVTCSLYHSVYAFLIVQLVFYVLMAMTQRSVDATLNLDVTRAWSQYPILHDPSERLPKRVRSKRLAILSCYTISSVGFASLMMAQLLDEGPIWGQPCQPNQRGSLGL